MTDESPKQAVAKSTPLITNNTEALADIRSFQDAVTLLHESGVETHSTADYGDGFTLQDKDTLEGEPFIVLGVKFPQGDFGTDFLVVHCVTKSGRKVIFTDGSTGVCEEMRAHHKQNRAVGLIVPKGLRKSSYEYIDPNGQSIPATTWYLT